MKKMNRLVIHQLHNVLTMLKGFNAGYTSDNNSEMIVNYEGQNFKITIEHLESGELTNDVVKKYL